MAVDITIVANGCQVTFDNADIALGWLRAVTHNISVDSFVDLVKAVLPGQTDMINNAKSLVTECFGQAV